MLFTTRIFIVLVKASVLQNPMKSKKLYILETLEIYKCLKNSCYIFSFQILNQ